MKVKFSIFSMNNISSLKFTFSYPFRFKEIGQWKCFFLKVQLLLNRLSMKLFPLQQVSTPYLSNHCHYTLSSSLHYTAFCTIKHYTRNSYTSAPIHCSKVSSALIELDLFFFNPLKFPPYFPVTPSDLTRFHITPSRTPYKFLLSSQSPLFLQPLRWSYPDFPPYDISIEPFPK